MHSCCPLLSAEGTEFVAGYSKNGILAIKINVGDQRVRELYQQLVVWMVYASYPGASKAMDKKASDALWASIAK
jgi:hypothetical protein